MSMSESYGLKGLIYRTDIDTPYGGLITGEHALIPLKNWLEANNI